VRHGRPPPDERRHPPPRYKHRRRDPRRLAGTDRGPAADGNPACPASDVWGKSPTGKGIVVTYWATGSDVVTVLVRGRSGDVAKTAVINPEDRFRMFEFDDTDAAAVDRVVIMSNTVRCYARPDPGTAPR
jgi:hypothetical protein